MGQSSPEQIESLLRFLIYLVLHKEKMDPEEYKKGSAGDQESQTERTKKSLLELLKNDESLRKSVFGGSMGGQDNMMSKGGAMDRVSDEDRQNLNKFGVGPQPF